MSREFVIVIYKNYDQEALDGQYNNRAAVPDFAEIVREWERRSESLRRRVPFHADLRYGKRERERLDIFPADRDGVPVQVFFHGGYWQSLDKEMFHFIAEGFTSRGAAAALVNYPLAPNASMDEIVASCRNAMVWLHRHASEYGGDPGNIYISGHSAGGHIVSMLMAADFSALADDAPADLIKGGCAVSGLFDLSPIRFSYVNDVLGMDEETARCNSPLFLSPPRDAPLIVCVGELESDEYHAQSQAFSTAWTHVGVPVAEMTAPGADHYTILDQLIDADAPLYRSMLEQMEIGK